MSHQQQPSYLGDLPTVTVVPPPSSPKAIPVTSYDGSDMGYGSFDSYYSNGLGLSPDSPCGVITPESFDSPYGSYSDSNGLFAPTSLADSYSNGSFLTEDVPSAFDLDNLGGVINELHQLTPPEPLSINTSCFDQGPIIPMPTPHHHHHLDVPSPYSPSSPASSYGSLSPAPSSAGGLSPHWDRYAPLPPSPGPEQGSPTLGNGPARLGRHRHTQSMRASPYPSSYASSSSDAFSISPNDTLRRARSHSASSSTGAPGRPVIAQVATESILRANEARRKHAATHRCEYEGCAQTFTTAFSMRRHMVGHTEDRPFKCSRCGQGFKNQSDCKRHEKSNRKHSPGAGSPQ